MKIKDVLVIAAIGLLGAACSDDERVVNGETELEVRKRIWMYLPMINGLM